MEILKNYIERIPGYKIPDSHFRLGSKIHISDFYYAKRMFQNSFFASKFSFIIARYILDNYNIKKTDLKKGLTLIGYGLYSELIISLIENLIKKSWAFPNVKINHNIVNDSEGLDLIKGYEQLYPNAIIIVPIASTFNTSIKIEEKLVIDFADLKVLSPHINILLVSHENIGDYEFRDGEVLIPSITKDFGWKFLNREKNIVGVESSILSNEIEEITLPEKASIREQKFFLSLPTTWYNIKDCEKCFPIKVKSLNTCLLKECDLKECPNCAGPELYNNCLINEKPLFVTDKTSVTPSLIFDLPRGRNFPNYYKIDKFIITPEILKYKHWIRDESHYHYYIQVEDFFKINLDTIKKWLAEKVKPLLDYKNTEYALIIAPGHYSNANFINLVNEIIFYNSANIIHYDPRKDHIQNFSLFYKKEIEKANKIYFVDDTITTGSTFIVSNRFVKHIRSNIGDNRSTESKKGFDSCIILFDRSSHYVHENLIRKLPKSNYFSFANIHLPSTRDLDGDCPLCKEENRYISLYENSYLDRLRYHFLQQSVKLIKNDIHLRDSESIKTQIQINYFDKFRYVKRIEAIHRIYQWFSNKIEDYEFDEYKTLEVWIKDLIGNTESPFIEPLLKSKSDSDLSESSDTILKVLTQPPFIQFKPLRKKTFNWVLLRLFAKIKEVKFEIENSKLEDTSFRDLKFLIRRAGLLNANYLISERLFELLELLYKKNGIDALNSNIENKIEQAKKQIKNKSKITIQQDIIFQETPTISQFEEMQQNLLDFNVFFAAQVKELIFENEARSIHVEQIINRYKNTNTPASFKQLLRILQEENGILIQRFTAFFESILPWDRIEIEFNDDPIAKISTLLKHQLITNHFRYNTLNDFFNVTGEAEIHENSAFHHYLCLVKYLNNDQNQIDSLSHKTDFIINCLKNIIIDISNKKNGAFFIVKYISNETNPYFISYNKGNSMNNIDIAWKNDSSNYLKEFFHGIKDSSKKSFKTVIEFRRNENNEWIDLYSIDKSGTDNNINPELLSSEFNRLIMFRINKREISKTKRSSIDEPQGIIGFYFRQDDENLTPITKIRYILLLLPIISKFIHNHHENNEFRDWIETDLRKRLALLSGHGKEMLMEIANKNDRYKRIVFNLEHLQLISLLEKNIKNFINDNESKFMKFYNVEGVNEINNDYILSLINMAKDIFYFSEIENRVDVDIDKDEIIENISFPFSKQILDLICFELLVNAKKNRWHFINNEKIDVYSKNKLWVKVREDSENKTRLLKLSIANTGPNVSNYDLRRLRSGVNLKPNETSGITLINSLLDNFKLGKISFFQDDIEKNTGLSKFTVELTLNAMQ